MSTPPQGDAKATDHPRARANEAVAPHTGKLVAAADVSGKDAHEFLTRRNAQITSNDGSGPNSPEKKGDPSTSSGHTKGSDGQGKDEGEHKGKDGKPIPKGQQPNDQTPPPPGSDTAKPGAMSPADIKAAIANINPNSARSDKVAQLQALAGQTDNQALQNMIAGKMAGIQNIG